MFLEHRPTQQIIEILSVEDLWDCCCSEVLGRSHAGEELQDPTLYPKSELKFLSGEPLPICWLNPRYRERRPQEKRVALVHL